MRGQKFRNLAMMLFAALVLTSTGQAWAAVTGTEAGSTVSNTASVTFTINSNTSSKTSPTVDFLIDRKIRPVVTNVDASNEVYVIPGADDLGLSFGVTNLSNTIEGSTEYFYLEVQDGAGGTLTMNNVEIWEDTNADGTPDNILTGDGRVVVISNTVGSNTERYMIVADTPAGATAPDTDVYNLVATAWSGATVADGALAEDAVGTTPGTNDHDESEIVFADDATAGDYAADIANDGRHSDLGTFTLSDPITITKTVGDGTSGYHIPGDEVTYTITVQNTDTANAATGVTIVDVIPTAPTAVNYVVGSLSCSTGTAQWDDGSDAWTAAEADATQVRCFNGTLAAAAAGPPVEPTIATMTFRVSIP